ncbi:MAG: hypothetical protein COW00_09895 [Bdellovibrio sp. CG12_big_fil_rev_8_21_14_0_65_39_13]|nr:MAG: hypothetical protein COW00_09895 [Bdellovibrio sp. CG12_big_fil_rev_8_21_14_0_65_39_13]
MKLALLLSFLFSLSAFGAGRCPTVNEQIQTGQLMDKYDFKGLKEFFIISGTQVDSCRNDGTTLGWATQIYGKMWDEGRLDEVNGFIDFLLKNGANPNLPLAIDSNRPIDELAQVCATDQVYKLIAHGADFKKPYVKRPFYTRTILSHVMYCAELADFFLNKHNMPVLEQDACLAFKESKNKWDAQYDRDLREAGFSGLALPVFIKKIKEQYGWDVAFEWQGRDTPESLFCDELRERDMPAPRN